MSEDFMDCGNVRLPVYNVFQENGPNNPNTRHCTPYSNLGRVKGSFVDCMGIFHWAYASILRVHKSVSWNHASSEKKVKSNMRA
jgi:hypothetical protein